MCLLILLIGSSRRKLTFLDWKSLSTFFRSDKACHLFHFFPRKCVTYVVFCNSQNVSKWSESQKISLVKKKKMTPSPFWRVTVSLHCISILHHTGRTSINKMITDLDCYNMIYQYVHFSLANESIRWWKHFYASPEAFEVSSNRLQIYGMCA